MMRQIDRRRYRGRGDSLGKHGEVSSGQNGNVQIQFPGEVDDCGEQEGRQVSFLITAGGAAVAVREMQAGRKQEQRTRDRWCPGRHGGKWRINQRCGQLEK